VRVTHFEIPSPKYYIPLSPILLSMRFRSKEERLAHFDISFPKHFAIFSPFLYQAFFK